MILVVVLLRCRSVCWLIWNMFGTIIFAHSFCLSNRLFIIYFNKSITNKSTSRHFGRISRNVIVETSELVAFVTYQKYKIIIYSVSFTYLTYHLMASFLLPICLRCKNIFSFIQLISILRRAHTVKVNKFIDSCKKLVVNFMLSSCDSVFNYLLKIFKTKLTKKKMKSAPFFRVICCCVSTSYLFCTLYFFLSHCSAIILQLFDIYICELFCRSIRKSSSGVNKRN